MTERFRHLRNRGGDLGIEVVAIVFSVLLAFAVDDCRQELADQQLVENVMTTIRDELEHNRGEIEKALPHHRDLARQLRGGGLKLLSLDWTLARVDLEDAESVKAFLRGELVRQGAPIPPDFSVSKMADGFMILLGDRPFHPRIEGDSIHIYGEGGIQLRPALLRNAAWETAQATRATVHMEYRVVSAMSAIYRIQQRHEATVSKIVDMLYEGRGTILPALEDLITFERELLTHYEALLARS